MNGSVALALFVLAFPVLAGGAMLWFMMGGKGKPAPTQDEIKAAKARQAANNQPSE